MGSSLCTMSWRPEMAPSAGGEARPSTQAAAGLPDAAATHPIGLDRGRPQPTATTRRPTAPRWGYLLSHPTLALTRWHAPSRAQVLRYIVFDRCGAQLALHPFLSHSSPSFCSALLCLIVTCTTRSIPAATSTSTGRRSETNSVRG